MEGWMAERTEWHSRSVRGLLYSDFLPKAHWLADFCPLASSSTAPSVGGPGSPVGRAGDVSGAGAHELRTSRVISPLHHAHPTPLRSAPRGREEPVNSYSHPKAKNSRHACQTCHTPLAGSLAEQSGDGAGRSPRGPEKPSDAAGLVAALGLWAWRVGKNDFSWDPFPFLSSGSQGRWTGDRRGSFCRGRAFSALNFP